MSFVSDELANVLKSVYMMEGSSEKDGDDDSLKAENKNGEVSKEKRPRKHKHKKHSKSKSKDKKKHKKRRHKSRSRSPTQSRSRSRTPNEIEHDFVLEKEKVGQLDSQENGVDHSNRTVPDLAQTTSVEKPFCQDVCESKTCDSNEEKLDSSLQSTTSESNAPKEDLNSTSTCVKTDKDRSSSRDRSETKSKDPKGKKSASSSRSRSKSPDSKLFGNNHKKDSRSHSKDRKTKRKSRSRSSSRQSSHKKKSRSRSNSQNKSFKKRSKSRSCSKERHRKRTVSKSRSRSHLHSSRSRSRSPSHKKRSYSRHKRSRSRSHQKSPVYRSYRRFSPPRWKRNIGSFRGRRSRSRSRSRRSPARRSSPRRRQTRSRSRGKRSHSRSRTHSHSRRSRSLSRDRRRNRSRSRSRSYSRGRGRRSTSRDRRRSKSRSRSNSKEKSQTSNTLSVPSLPVVNKVSALNDKPVPDDLSVQQAKVAQRAGGKTIAELTAFCKKLQEEKESANSNTTSTTAQTEEDDSQPVAHHPFLVQEKPDITIPPVIFPVNKPIIPTVDLSKPLQEQFPVSCGSKHREKETVSDDTVVANVDGSAIQIPPKVEVFHQQPAEKLDISELVAKRMDAQRRLQSDPNDIEALLTLQEIQMKMQNWCQSNVKPGQYTGELVKNLLPKENLQGGFQAWVKKDMFQNLTPVSGGIGMKLLQKMGWKPGQVIGKRGEGYAEPISLTVKIDRKGLSTGKEKAPKKGAPAVLDLQGKHPVSALAEYCSKRKWQLPDYTLVFDHGPAHHKQFLFKVLVNSVEYQPAVVCGNKKQAKAQAAIYALKSLGLIPEDADISAI